MAYRSDSDNFLVYPGDPDFESVLGSILPFDWREEAWKSCGDYCFVADSESGLLRTATPAETREYLEGGEYEERLASIGDEM
ncbi:hypothetical protein H6F74_05615 [Trichocoleus sp. FACHB-90]|uniref:hypothetical protein n=1 Tax=Cyanophyceae TaxID=3028117 RepID=UPI00168A206B|nr:hypothetical protein [Trichocoleus sp. FACHB-90]MBD1925760.1 hypothetical protein [Trichocoleus sp. FACHB-90]